MKSPFRFFFYGKIVRNARWQGAKSSNDDVNQPPSEMVTIGNDGS